MYIEEDLDEMASGRPKQKVLILRRAQGNRVLSLYREGPFITVFLDDILIGKARGKSDLLAPAGTDFEECIRLPHYTVLLTVEEVTEINAAMTTESPSTAVTSFE